MGSAKNAKRLRRAQRELLAGNKYWHGGAAGLQVGELILPPSHTGAASTADLADMPTRRDRVYFTTVYELARGYAAHTSGRNAVYQVEPLGQVETDPDYPRVGWQAAKARIVEVSENDVTMTPQQRTQLHQPYERYEDGGLIHDEAGRLLLSTRMAENGFDQAYLDANVPRWTELEAAAEQLAKEFYRRRPQLKSPFS